MQYHGVVEVRKGCPQKDNAALPKDDDGQQKIICRS